MKCTVIREYIDKETLTFNDVGEVVDVTDERFAEINNATGYTFLEVKEEKPKAKKSK